MKKILIYIPLFSTIFARAQTTSENYIKTTDCLNEDCSRKTETVQYFDFLGRPKQTVNVKSTPQSKDIVFPIVYDGSGKQTRTYLPIPQSTTTNGAYYTQSSDQVPYPVADDTGFYGGEKIYTETTFEKSPLGRTLQQKNTGNAWNNKAVIFGYDVNNTADHVKNYAVSAVWDPAENLYANQLQPVTEYEISKLIKNTVTDEDGNSTIEFKDGKGQVIMIRKMLSATEKADTYYVYNEYGQLAYVIPPLVAVSGTIDTVPLNNLCYQYRYDSKGRLVEKKLPGKGWEHMVYDKADRLIATQDAVMRQAGKWFFTKYDKLGRVIYTGIIPAAARPSLQAITNNYVITESRNDNGFSKNGMQIYYTNDLYNQIETVLSVNYYDTLPPLSPSFTPTMPGYTVLPQNAQNSNISTKSLPVASYVKNIEDDNWTKNYTWYDTKGRVAATQSINHLGGYTKTESQLDFSGTPQNTKIDHVRKPNEAGVTVKQRFVYDSQNRLLQNYHQVDDKLEVLLTDNTYNELSQLKNKKVGNNLQSIDYAYNIRGWMTDINKEQMSIPNLDGKLFAYKIRYNEKVGIENPSPAQFAGKNVVAKYNGNIAEVDWRSVETLGVNPSLNAKRYGYAYDQLNRLTAGYYQNPDNPYSKENTESIDYDLNGNITDLFRTSVTEYGSTIATVTDNLEYIYTAGDNKVTNINDYSTNITGYEGGGQTIGYDVNGNMQNMADKGISTIKYNLLNLPYQLKMQASVENITIDSKYRADGTRLRKQNTTITSGFGGDMTTIKTTDYLDGFQYLSAVSLSPPPTGGGSNGRSLRAMEPQAFSIEQERISLVIKTPDLQFFPTAEGYYDYQKDQYIYQYVDHLGNARVSFGRNSAGALEITDANDYYPFGMNHLKTGNAFFGQGSYKNYKYNGKELQETGTYDYGARFYMPDIGRWGVVDPLAEVLRRHTPYNYGVNNPISFIDPDGRLSISFSGEAAQQAFSAYKASMSTADTDGESAWPPRRGSYEGESYSDKDGSWSWNEQYDRWNGVNGSKNVMLIERGTEVCCNLENTKVMTYSDVIAENMRVPMSELDGPIKMMGGAGDIFGIWELLGILLGASDSNAKYAILPLMVVKGQGDDALKMLNAEKGAFSVADWSKYPSAIPKPAGPFRLLEGAEYDAARKAANQANQAMRRSNPEAYKGLEIHEIHPVKYGGSPTDPANKIAIPRDYHRKEVTPWWNNNLRSTK